MTICVVLVKSTYYACNYYDAKCYYDFIYFFAYLITSCCFVITIEI